MAKLPNFDDVDIVKSLIGQAEKDIIASFGRIEKEKEERTKNAAVLEFLNDECGGLTKEEVIDIVKKERPENFI